LTTKKNGRSIASFMESGEDAFSLGMTYLH